MMRKIPFLALSLLVSTAILATAQETEKLAKADPPKTNLEALTGTVEKPESEKGEAAQIDFARDVLPIFEARCLECHGPEKQKNGLRVDRRESLLQGGDYGPAVIPGEPDKSNLFIAVSGMDEDLVMPPKGDPLTPEQVATLRAWIEQGAEWSGETTLVEDPAIDHWAFQPVERPGIPELKDPDWVANAVDAFILRRLETEGIEPSRPADRWTLIRRLSLDLTGLPPSPQEVKYFVNDTNPYAYQRLVNRLLASPHFGERWGRHWLDLARYADSDGYEKDQVRPHAWRYREWVIEALNRDLPYDQFVTEQLAGDLLPDPRLDQLVATGFHRNTLTNKEGGIDEEEDRVKQAVDRVNTTCSVFLGLTMGCCQCHSHKFDPLSQREYFGMYGFFNQAIEKDVPAPLAGEVQNYHRAQQQWDTKHAELENEIAKAKKSFAKQLPEWEAENDYKEVKWELLEPTEMKSAKGVDFNLLSDGSILVDGENPNKVTYDLTFDTTLENITGFRLAALTHDSLPKNGPGRSNNGYFILSEFQLLASAKGASDASGNIAFSDAWSDRHEDKLGASDAIDGTTKTGWSVKPKKGHNENRVAFFIPQDPVGVEGGTTLRFTLDHQQGEKHTLGRFKLFAYSGDTSKIDTAPPDIPGILALSPEERSDEQQDRLLKFAGESDREMIRLYSALDTLAEAAPTPPDTQAPTLAENPKDVTTQIHIRGDFLRKGQEVRPHTPAVLTSFKPRNGHPDRLDLARWIVDPENPLTARVAANRIWRHLMGHGIVETSEDFGTRGEKPTHPELLDWLASEYIARGWSTKEMIRVIVNSNTYKQVSHARGELVDSDPKNRWLARQNRSRVDAEIVRDLALAASRLLNRSVGGPSIRPPLPPGVAELGYNKSVKWKESPGTEKYRRGLYILFQRTVPYPMLMTFDCPDSNVTCVRRTVSNTPLQALTLLNNGVFVECSQALGKNLLEMVPDDETDRVRLAYLRCLAREPHFDEIDAMKSLLEDQRSLFGADAKAAVAMAGENPPEGFDAAETAAWVTMARVLMNLDEFVTRE